MTIDWDLVLKMGEILHATLKNYLDKGSHPLRKVQFFLTLFKRPLTPPPLFEHLSFFAGGVF